MTTPDLPSNLPPLPPVPEGFDRWEYRGIGWKTEHPVMYDLIAVDWQQSHDVWCADDDAELMDTSGNECFHYIEAVREPANPLQHPAGPKDWPEDDALENGGYQNNCPNCQGVFYGHKRRAFCRECCQPATDQPAVGTLFVPCKHCRNSMVCTQIGQCEIYGAAGVDARVCELERLLAAATEEREQMGKQAHANACEAMEYRRQRDAYAETLRLIAESPLAGVITPLIRERHPELAAKP